MAGHFPVQRIKRIMKSSAEVENISKESTIIVTRAAELFVKLLTKEAYKDSKKVKKLDYKNIANAVNMGDRYEFLREMIPHKITVGEYYKIMKEKGNENDHNSSVESSSAEEDDHAKENNASGSDSDIVILD